MATIPEIKTNLFSFNTFRSPDKIDPTEKQIYFIEHPDISQSYFNSCPVYNPTSDKSSNEYTQFLESFDAYTSYRNIRQINPSFYDFSVKLMQQKKNDSTKKPFEEPIPAPLSMADQLILWDQLFYQIAARETVTVRKACEQMIIAQRYVEKNRDIELKDLGVVSVIFPELVLNCFKPWVYRDCGGKLYGVHNLGIQEFRRVEQTLCCYVPGEVSHIENVMAAEYKERSTRNLLRTEYTTEITSEVEVEKLNDTTSTERNELSSEISKELQNDKSFDVSGSVSVSKKSKMIGNITANASTSYNNSTTSSLANTEAKNYAKEITERALERVVQKMTERRTSKMIREFEENNKHGFDNRLGTKHITGVYRWVDKIYTNQLVNYGRRLMFETDIPHPALLYKKALNWKSPTDEIAGATLTPPKTLAEFGINSSQDITNDNADLAAGAYGVTVDSFQTEIQFISLDYNPTGTVENSSHTQSQVHPSLIIPQGFVATKIDGICTYEYQPITNYATISLNFSGYEAKDPVQHKKNGTTTFDFSINLNESIIGSMSCVVSYKRTVNYGGSIKVKCITDPALELDWKESTYETLLNAYQVELEKYNEELALQQAANAAAADQVSNPTYSNEALNRLIEERELKRACIEMMSKPYCFSFGKNFYSINTNCENKAEIPQINISEGLERYAQFVKFFETAFQWEILTYVFYPYYYNETCDWPELIQIKNDDPIFEAFLQSGMAKLLIPVRPQYEKAVLYYMETGEIYTDGDLVPDFEDDRYASVLKDVADQNEIKVEGTWETRVPSTLTIIQAKSTYFEDEQGLPCCKPENELFIGNDDILLGLNQ